MNAASYWYMHDLPYEDEVRCADCNYAITSARKDALDKLQLPSICPECGREMFNGVIHIIRRLTTTEPSN